MWWALAQLGHDGLRERVRGARGVAARAVDALTAMGWAAWRHPHACTVGLDPAPPEPIARRWALPVADGISHLVCVPGVSDARTAAFLTDLAAATGRPATISPRRQRRPAIPHPALGGLRPYDGAPGGVPLPQTRTVLMIDTVSRARVVAAAPQRSCAVSMIPRRKTPPPLVADHRGARWRVGVVGARWTGPTARTP